MELQIVKTIPQRVKDYSFIIVASFGGIWVIRKIINAIRNDSNQKKTEAILQKWSTSPKGIVIIHTLPRGKTAPSPSPFVIKLETYLRMANIPYEMDYESPWSPKGKTPWITFNGEHISDSQLIIEFLARECKKSVGNSYTNGQKAVARSVRIMMDEHFYWGLGLWRYVYSGGQGLSEIMEMSPAALKELFFRANARVKIASWYQGLGRHNKETVIEIMSKNLEAVSLILGSKKFLLGDEPCEEDCSVFGFLSQVLWCAPGSPYQKFLTENLQNLNDYCIRMKETFWPDWDDCLAGSTSTGLLLREAEF